jgi:hypothetical protein
MLVVLLLLPLFLAMNDGKFGHGGGGGGGGGSSSGSGGGGGNGQRLAAKVASNESIDGCMMACNDNSGWQTTTQQPTNDQSSKHGRW